jgi:hypothetical protein
MTNIEIYEWIEKNPDKLRAGFQAGSRTTGDLETKLGDMLNRVSALDDENSANQIDRIFREFLEALLACPDLSAIIPLEFNDYFEERGRHFTPNQFVADSARLEAALKLVIQETFMARAPDCGTSQSAADQPATSDDYKKRKQDG